MSILGKKRESLLHDLNETETLMETAKANGIEIMPHKQSLFLARKAIKDKRWQEAEGLIDEAWSKLTGDIELFRTWAKQKERERMETQNMISRIEWYHKELNTNGIEMKIKLLDDVKIALDGGTDVDMKAALNKIESMFTRPIFKPEKMWSYKIDDEMRTVLLYNSGIIFGTKDNLVCYIDGDKNIQWKFRAKGEISGLCSIGSLIFVASKDKNVYCLDGLGKFIWSFDTNGEITLVKNTHDLILVGSADKNIYCIDKRGKQLWKFKTGGPVISLDVINDQIFSTSTDGHFYYINQNGELQWKKKFNGPIISINQVGKLILVQSSPDSLHCFGYNQTLEWKKVFEKSISSLQTYYDRAYIGFEDKKIICLDVHGEQMWESVVEGIPLSIIGYKDLLLVGTSENNLLCIDLNGNSFWKYKTGNRPISIRASYEQIIVQTINKVIVYSTSAIPVFLSIEKHIREGRIKFTNIYEAEQLFELAKKSFADLEGDKSGRLLNKVKEIISEHQKRISQTEKRFGVHKPKYDEFDQLLEAEYRDNVTQGINSARKTITDIQSILTTLLGKRANIESSISKQRDDERINDLIVNYRKKLERARDREKASVARSYAFMIVNQRKKLQMKDKMRSMILDMDEQIKELSDFSEDLFENANEMPNDADLVGAFGILNNEALQAINDANQLVGKINLMESEINEVALESEFAVGDKDINVDGLHSDVKAEIEKELQN